VIPLYEYYCPTCRATFELLKPMSRSSQPASCPQGHKGAERTVSLIAARAWGAGQTTAAASNGGCGGCAGGACACGR
jgi:putative FmdB family regulatory protein